MLCHHGYLHPRLHAYSVLQKLVIWGKVYTPGGVHFPEKKIPKKKNKKILE